MAAAGGAGAVDIAQDEGAAAGRRARAGAGSERLPAAGPSRRDGASISSRAGRATASDAAFVMLGEQRDLERAARPAAGMSLNRSYREGNDRRSAADPCFSERGIRVKQMGKLAGTSRAHERGARWPLDQAEYAP